MRETPMFHSESAVPHSASCPPLFAAYRENTAFCRIGFVTICQESYSHDRISCRRCACRMMANKSSSDIVELCRRFRFYLLPQVHSLKLRIDFKKPMALLSGAAIRRLAVQVVLSAAFRLAMVILKPILSNGWRIVPIAVTMARSRKNCIVC